MFRVTFSLLIFSLGLCAAPRLVRLNLLQFRDVSGKVATVKTPADWQKRRTEILKGMEAVMGRFPGKDRRVKLEVKVEEEVDAGTSGTLAFFEGTYLFVGCPGSVK